MPDFKFGSHKLNSIIRGANEFTKNGYGKTEGYQRPDHPDFWTSKELKEKEWTGVRQNEITRCFEFWIVGELRREVREEDVQKDNGLLGRIHLELFAMIPDNLLKLYNKGS